MFKSALRLCMIALPFVSTTAFATPMDCTQMLRDITNINTAGSRGQVGWGCTNGPSTAYSTVMHCTTGYGAGAYVTYAMYWNGSAYVCGYTTVDGHPALVYAGPDAEPTDYGDPIRIDPSLLQYHGDAPAPFPSLGGSRLRDLNDSSSLPTNPVSSPLLRRLAQ